MDLSYSAVGLNIHDQVRCGKPPNRSQDLGGEKAPKWVCSTGDVPSPSLLSPFSQSHFIYTLCGTKIVISASTGVLE